MCFKVEGSVCRTKLLIDPLRQDITRHGDDFRHVHHICIEKVGCFGHGQSIHELCKESAAALESLHDQNVVMNLS